MVTASIQPFTMVSVHQVHAPTGGVASEAADVLVEIPTTRKLENAVMIANRIRFISEHYLSRTARDFNWSPRGESNP